MRHLLADPDDRRDAHPPPRPLLLVQGGHDLLLPDEATVLQSGDRLLFAGAAGAEALQSRLLDDDVAIDYVRTGVERPRTWLGRWLQRGHGPGDGSGRREAGGTGMTLPP